MTPQSSWRHRDDWRESIQAIECDPLGIDWEAIKSAFNLRSSSMTFAWSYRVNAISKTNYKGWQDGIILKIALQAAIQQEGGGFDYSQLRTFYCRKFPKILMAELSSSSCPKVAITLPLEGIRKHSIYKSLLNAFTRIRILFVRLETRQMVHENLAVGHLKTGSHIPVLGFTGWTLLLYRSGESKRAKVT